jgi:hypothetical protein
MPHVSRFLSIECEWIDQPLAADPLERRTWARIALSAAGRSVTRLWDRDAQAERMSLYLPAFPLARWLVANWWTMLYEPAPLGASEPLPASDGDRTAKHRDWLLRHCLRTAESGLLLPYACWFSDGRRVVIDWAADDEDAYPHMPGYFVESGRVSLDRGEVQSTLWEFISGVIRRLDGESDERVGRLRQAWEAVIAADPEEEAFCRSAGRMGLDPYEIDHWEPSLVDLLESRLGSDLDQPLVADFLEAAEAETAAAVWQWVDETRASFDLRKSPMLASHLLLNGKSPAKIGYQLARRVRESMAGRSQGPLEEVGEAASAMGIEPIEFVDRDHHLSPRVKATVGWRAGKQPLVAGPRPSREDNARFLQARSLYHAAWACSTGPRLLTEARTWDQQASRAFAAELLAPQAELEARFDDGEWAEDPEAVVGSLAAEYRVSKMIVWHQLENLGIRLG